MALYLYDDPGTLYDTATYDSLALVLAVGQPKVELLLNSVWTDVTVFARVDDGIQIQRGRSDEQSAPVPATCSVTFDNADGRFTPSYTSGAYYPYIIRNTQLRVSVLLDDLVTYSIRFWGEVSEWPIHFDYTGTDVRVTVTAAGPRRRLARQAVPVNSAYTTAMGTQTKVLAYWPMEDGDGATQFANAVAGGVPAGYTVTSGSLTPAADSTWAASDPLPTFDGVVGITGIVPAYTPDASGQIVRFWLEVNCPTINQGFDVIINTSGAHKFIFEYVPQSNLGALAMLNYSSGVTEYTSGAFNLAAFLETGCRMQIDLKQNGTGIDFDVHGYTPGDPVGFHFGVATIPSATLGYITNVQAAGNGVDVVATFGQLSVENHIISQFDFGVLALSGYDGETAYARADRVIGSNVHVMVGTAASSELLGVQEKDTPLNLFDEAAFVDGGLSTESVDAFSLSWRTRASMLAQSSAPLLSLVRLTDLEQTADDQNTQNDVTVARINGASARRVAATGLTPALVGTYAAGYSLSLHADTQAGPQAEWRLTNGSLDLPRYPVVAFDAVSGLTSGIRTDLVTLREGGTFSMTSTGGGYLGLTSPTIMRCLGWTETFLPGQWLWQINATHGSPFSDAFILDSTGNGVLDTNRLGM